MPSVTIVGAGAIGGWLASLFHAAGWDVRLLARGATLAAISEHGLLIAAPSSPLAPAQAGAHGFAMSSPAAPESGWMGPRLRGNERVMKVTVRTSDDPAELGATDYLLISLKAYDLPPLAERLAPLVGEHTAVVSAMNGLPWWFFDGFGGPLEGAGLESIDPGGALKRLIPAQRVIGCVVHATAETTAPGQVRVIAADKLIVGEASPLLLAGEGGGGGGVRTEARQKAREARSPTAPTRQHLREHPHPHPSPLEGEGLSRVDLLADAWRGAGVETEISPDIRRPIWVKLWGNMSMNPLGALTRATTGRLLDDPLTRELVHSMMLEMAALGERIGLPLGMAPEERMAITRRLGDFKTSMQRDAEAGRRLELDALLSVLVEMAERLGQPAPNLRAVYALTRQLDLSLRQVN